MTAQKVMLVDDDETIRSLVRLTLPTGEFEVVEAGDGWEALDLLDGEAPQLVVLDWKMPERSGEEVLAESKRRYPDLPVIVLTAEHEARHRMVAHDLGADEFLTKPFSPLPQLIGAIERLTDRAPG